MISKQTLKYFQLTVAQGYFLKMYSFSIQDSNVAVRDSGIVRRVTFLCSLSNIIAIIILGLAGFVYTEDKIVTFLSFACIISFCSCFTMQMWHLYYMDDIPKMISEFLQLNKDLCEGK